MREFLRFILLYVVAPFIKIVGAIAGPVYTVLFAWNDDRIHRRLNKELEDDIRETLGWLFATHGAQFLRPSDEGPRGFDYASATLAMPLIHLRFIRGRGELRADITSGQSPDDWRDFGEVVAHVNGTGKTPRYFRLQEFSRLLRLNIDDVLRHYSAPENYEWRSAYRLKQL